MYCISKLSHHPRKNKKKKSPILLSVVQKIDQSRTIETILRPSKTFEDCFTRHYAMKTRNSLKKLIFSHSFRSNKKGDKYAAGA